MAPLLQPVTSDLTLPARVDVVVIGGGIIGVCTAYHLAKKGVAVALCEKGVYRRRTVEPQLGLCARTHRPRPGVKFRSASRVLRSGGTMNEDVGEKPDLAAPASCISAKPGRTSIWRCGLAEQTHPYQVNARLLDFDEVADTAAASNAVGQGSGCATDGVGVPLLAAPAVAEKAGAALARTLTRRVRFGGSKTIGGAVSAGLITRKGALPATLRSWPAGRGRAVCGAHGRHFPQFKILAFGLFAVRAPVRGRTSSPASGPRFRIFANSSTAAYT